MNLKKMRKNKLLRSKEKEQHEVNDLKGGAESVAV